MRRPLSRTTLLFLALAALLSASALALLATTPTDLGERAVDPERLNRRPPGGFQPCPSPPCMAPCLYPPASEVLCREPNGSVEVTSFTCCCCGGSSGVTYRPL